MSKEFVNLLSELDINEKFSIYLLVFTIANLESFIVYKNNGWCHFVELIGSAELLCLNCFLLLRSFFYFLWSLLLGEALREICQYLE